MQEVNMHTNQVGKAMLWICLAIFCLYQVDSIAASQKKDLNEPTEALDAIKSYRCGQSRINLTLVEQYVRDSHGNRSARQQLEHRLIDILLSPEATTDSKRFVCRQLSLIGTDAAVEALAEL